jgi:hypothetical protein
MCLYVICKHDTEVHGLLAVWHWVKSKERAISFLELRLYRALDALDGRMEVPVVNM